jgi:hypothetical protein
VTSAEKYITGAYLVVLAVVLVYVVLYSFQACPARARGRRAPANQKRAECDGARLPLPRSLRRERELGAARG